MREWYSVSHDCFSVRSGHWVVVGLARVERERLFVLCNGNAEVIGCAAPPKAYNEDSFFLGLLTQKWEQAPSYTE